MENIFQLESSIELMDDTCFHGICECDGFMRSGSTLKLIQNISHQYMCLDGKHLVYQARAKSRSRDANCRFIIHRYRCSTADNGLPIMLQIQLGEHFFTVCCRQEEKSVYVRQDYKVPDTFEDRYHDALFFLQDIIGRRDLKRLESAKWPAYYLSFNDPYSVSDSGTGEVDSPGYPTVALTDIGDDENERTNFVFISV